MDGEWCNGSTTASGAVCLGSPPEAGKARLRRDPSLAGKARQGGESPPKKLILSIFRMDPS